MMQRSAELSASAARTLALRIRTTPLPSLGFRARGARLRSSGALAVIVALAAVIAIIVAGKLWLPKGLPNGIVLLGLELGALNALPAMGVVLVYRANRTLNFAQGEMGAFAASLVYLLVETLHWSWFIAVPVSLAAATTVGALVEI